MIIMERHKIGYIQYEKYPMHDCGGEFFPTGIVFVTDPPIHQYKCNKCGKLAEFQSCVFREVDE